jgi:hypothetical protein
VPAARTRRDEFFTSTGKPSCSSSPRRSSAGIARDFGFFGVEKDVAGLPGVAFPAGSAEFGPATQTAPPIHPWSPRFKNQRRETFAQPRRPSRLFTIKGGPFSLRLPYLALLFSIAFGLVVGVLVLRRIVSCRDESMPVPPLRPNNTELTDPRPSGTESPRIALNRRPYPLVPRLAPGSAPPICTHTDTNRTGRAGHRLSRSWILVSRARLSSARRAAG